MIVLLTAHTGSPALAKHLASDANERIAVSTYGLTADTLDRGLGELRRMALGSRSRTQVAHVCASPSIPYRDQDWATFWDEFEKEFGFEDQPYVEAVHLKSGAGGRTAEHAHRVYLRVRVDRTAIKLSHSYARCEKVARIAEFRAGERLICGAHTRAVVAALRREGRTSIADAIVRMGHADRSRPSAVRPVDRAQAERLQDMAPDQAGLLAWRAWTQSDSGPSFRAALERAGLEIAQGDKTVMLVGPNGLAIRLAQALRAPAKLEGQSIRKAEVDARIRGIKLPALDAVRPKSGAVRAADQATGVSRCRPVEVFSASGTIPKGHRLAGQGPAQKKDEQPTREPMALPAISEPPIRHKYGPRQMEAIERFQAEIAGGLARRISKESDDIRDEARSLAAHHRAKAMSRATQLDHRDRREGDLRRRIRRLLDAPTVGAVDWRADFKARLANVPARYGPLLRWVERQEGQGVTYLRLQTGALIAQMQDRVTVDVADPRTAAIMVAYAKRCRWRPVSISGGSPEWRQAVVREAALHGVEIANPEPRELTAETLLSGADADRDLRPEPVATASAPLPS